MQEIKTLNTIYILMLFVLTGCEKQSEDFVNNSSKNSETVSYVLSQDEVDSIILRKFGHSNFTLEEKSNFLSEHIAGILIGNTSVDNISSSAHRVSQDPTSILCYSEIYDTFTQLYYIEANIADPDRNPGSLVHHC